MTLTPRARLAPAAAALCCLLSVPAFASSPAEEAAKFHQGGAPHMKVEPPKTMGEAVTMLRSALAKIDVALGVPDYDTIHIATYSAEAAVARIAQEPGYDGLKSQVAPRIEIVHLASELGDGETLKVAVPAMLQAARGSLQLVLK
jgi:hypothetical protein